MEEGTLLRVFTKVGDVQVPRQCIVLRCNKRLTTCKVEWLDDQKVETIGLSTRQYEVLQPPNESPSTSGRTEEDARKVPGSALEPAGVPAQKSRKQSLPEIATHMVPSDDTPPHPPPNTTQHMTNVAHGMPQDALEEGEKEDGDADRDDGDDERDDGDDDGGDDDGDDDDGDDADGDDKGDNADGDGDDDGDDAGDDDDDDDSELDVFNGDTARLLDRFLLETSSVDVFVMPQGQVAELARSVAQVLYNHTSTSPLVPSQSGPSSHAILPELHVDGFDAEQIWLQLDMCVDASLRRVRRQLKKVGAQPQLISEDMEEALDELLGGNEEDGNGVPDEGMQDGEKTEEEGEDTDSANDDDDDDDDENEQEDESEEEGEEVNHHEMKEQKLDNKGKSKKAKAGGRNAVDDEFFKLEDLEKFLEDREKADQEEAERDGDDEDDDEDEDEDEDGIVEGDNADVDVEDSDDEEQRLDDLLNEATKTAPNRQKVAAVFDDDDDDEEMEEGGVSGGLTYKQFFDDSQGRTAGPYDDDDNDDYDNDDNNDDENDSGVASSDSEDDHLAAPTGRDWEGRGRLSDGRQDVKSAHERRVERMKARIAALEEQNMKEKEWFLKGEVQAGQRPLNSALEVDLDFERSVKPPPAPTEESTTDLESIIKKRIAEALFDDVVAVALPEPQKKKAVIELQDTRNEKALGELYEDEFMKATSLVPSVDEKLEKLRGECTQMMKHLTAKLDALSRFHFTPKPVIEEVAVKVNLPALAMEEVAPQVVSTADLQAPEDVFKPSANGGQLKEDGEFNREDRKRRRAAKKRAAKKRKLEKAAAVRSTAVQQGGTAPLAGRKSEAAEKLSKKAAKKKAASSSATTGQQRIDYTKSSALFAKLQDQQTNGGALDKQLKSREPGAKKASMLKL